MRAQKECTHQLALPRGTRHLISPELADKGVMILLLQVVGRAHKGLDMLNKLNEAAVDPNDLPLQPVLVTACGLCDSEVTSSPSPDSHSFPAGAVRTSLMRYSHIMS